MRRRAAASPERYSLDRHIELGVGHCLYQECVRPALRPAHFPQFGRGQFAELLCDNRPHMRMNIGIDDRIAATQTERVAPGMSDKSNEIVDDVNHLKAS